MLHESDDVESGGSPERPQMPNVDERLASLEARMETMNDLRSLIIESRSDMTRQFTELRGDMNRQFAELRGDMARQFADVRTEFTEVRGEIGQVRGEIGGLRGDMNRQFLEARDDTNRRFELVDRRMLALDAKEDRHFTWLIGIQMAFFIAIVGALAGAYYR